MKTKILSISLLALLILSCNKEPDSTTTTPTSPPSSTSSPAEFTIGGTKHSFASSGLYGFYDTNNDDVNVKTTPGLDPLNIGGFSLMDLDKDAVAGDTQSMIEFSGATFYFVESVSAQYTSESGTITFTSHDKTAKRIKGTFSCVVKNAFNTSQKKNVTGSFDFSYTTNLP
ncbi:MAG: hypothetical protein ACPGVD_10470 [Flavobacteriales bacterium]